MTRFTNRSQRRGRRHHRDGRRGVLAARARASAREPAEPSRNSSPGQRATGGARASRNAANPCPFQRKPGRRARPSTTAHRVMRTTAAARPRSARTCIKRARHAAAGDQGLTDGELYWIIENGIRFTGMPAWVPEPATIPTRGSSSLHPAPERSTPQTSRPWSRSARNRRTTSRKTGRRAPLRPGRRPTARRTPS